MKIRCMKKNNKGAVLELPMYLIIVMIVAVAVIAAIIFMLPQGTKMMKAQVTSGSTYSLGTTAGDGTYTFTPAFAVSINVFTADQRGDPIANARVRLSGAGVVYEQTTNNQGAATFSVANAKLDPNINEAYMTLTIKASGFEDYTDDSAVLLYRPT